MTKSKAFVMSMRNALEIFILLAGAAVMSAAALDEARGAEILAMRAVGASGLSDLPPAEPARFMGTIMSLAALREGVTRRNDYLSPQMTPQEIEDVVAYLNTTCYKFSQ